MIHEIGVELQTALQGIGCGFPVVDGPEPTTTATFGRERIVLEHDDKGEDSFEPSYGSSHTNPKIYFTRNQAMKIRIYGQNPATNALQFEHRRRVDHVLDLVLAQMQVVAMNRKNKFAPKSGRFVTDGELGASQIIGGAVYELRFTFDRGVAVQNWDGSFQKTTTVGAVVNTAEVSFAGDQTGGTPSTPPPDAEPVQ